MNLKQFINGHGGINAVNFIVPTSRGSAYHSMYDVKVKMRVENRDEKDIFSLEGGHKINLIPVENKKYCLNFAGVETDLYSDQRFYQWDLMDLICEGVVKVEIIEMIA